MIEKDEVQRRYNLWSQGYWEIPDNLDTTGFDFNWRPDQYDRPYIHQFGTQHQKTSGPRFIIPENEGIKYQSFQHAIKLPDINNRCWRPLLSNCTIDFSWHPDETEPPFIYVFGNQWHDAKTMPTYQYRVKGAIEKKYVTEFNAMLLPNKDNWKIPTDIDDSMFDYSWVPNPHEPLYIHQFGTQWQRTNGPQYMTVGATNVKYVDTMRVKKLPDMRKWRILDEIDTTKFDFSWHPDDTEPPMMYEFGTQWQTAGGPIYVTSNSTQKKYCGDQIAIRIAKEDRCYRPLVSNIEFDYSWHPNPNEPPYIYVFGNQWYDSITMPTLLYRVKGAIDKKYIDDIKVILLPDKDKFEITVDIDILFDYSWTPNPNDPPYEYVFGNQWYDSVTMPTIIYKNTKAYTKKYVDDIKATLLPNKSKFKVLEYVEDDFDYSWVPNPNDPALNYIFGNQYHTPEFMPTLMYRVKGATENKFVTDIKANLKIDSVVCEDSIFDKIKSHTAHTKYTAFNTSDNKVNYDIINCRDEKLYIHLIDNISAIVPREATINLYDKLTDYPYIKTHSFGYTNKLLDIIFFSNGEACADDNYHHLLSLNLPNRIIRIDGVKGRVASQHAAAHASNTPWYFLVNAKLKVNTDFDFNWHPSIFRSSRHYIFTATNPVNNLEYGHQAIVANNKKLTLNTVVRGLDFTMDSPTEIVKMNSGVSTYNTSAWDTWRTAFRECIKLRHAKDKDSGKRLSIWVSVAEGEFREYSIRGASDAVKYYNSVNGELDKLMLSYDWAWLRNKFDQNNLPLINTMIK